LRFHVSPL